ncbi:hypothetical protein [Colwellia sp. PAMC 21821]
MEDLDLSYNRLINIPDKLCDLKFKYLKLDDNPLVKLSNSLSG